MVKTLFLGALLAIGWVAYDSSAPGAAAQDGDQRDSGQQDGGNVAPDDHPRNGGAGIRSGNITSTGATVPNPGASQGAGTTDLDRGIQREDNKITEGICKGC